MPDTVAALFVETNGCYFGLDGVDPWDIHRDARLYTGPWPVVAHPPCERWGRYWHGGPTAHKLGRRRQLGDDHGCFAAAIAAVRQWGGVIEHPEDTHAWRAFDISKPPRSGGWVRADRHGWTCCVEQGSYGHSARKPTWLYAVGTTMPVLQWVAVGEFQRIDGGYHSAAQRQADKARGVAKNGQLSARARKATPLLFRDLLLDIARSAWTFGGSDAPQA
jgi:hypothetical protein